MTHYLHFYEIKDMELTFEYNSNADYSKEDLKGGYTGKDVFY